MSDFVVGGVYERKRPEDGMSEWGVIVSARATSTGVRVGRMARATYVDEEVTDRNLQGWILRAAPGEREPTRAPSISPADAKKMVDAAVAEAVKAQAVANRDLHQLINDLRDRLRAVERGPAMKAS